MEKPLIPISYIAEYSYCPRSAFYLLTDEPKLRDESAYIQSGRMAHAKVDEGYSVSKGSKKIETAVSVFSERLRMIGRVDILEFCDDDTIIPVELKRGKTRENKAHLVQLGLIALCLKEMFPEKVVAQAAIFFTEDRQKKLFKLSIDILGWAEQAASAVRNRVDSGLNPREFPCQKDIRCHGCCFYYLCYI